MVRMTNTFISAGVSTPEDIISSTERGVYVAQFGGGQVNTASGDFVFGMTEAFLIEDGRITDPIRDGNLIGNGPAALAALDAVGNDFAMGGPGTCGKDGQSVPVGTGTPTVRVPAADRGRHRIMSDQRAATTVVPASGQTERGSKRSGDSQRPRGTDELLALAERLVGEAKGNEQIEVTVGRSTSTNVRAYKGDVEQFTSATSFGVGIGYSSTGARVSPTPAASTQTCWPPPWRTPVTTPGSPSPTSGRAWPNPTGSPRSRSICGTSPWPISTPTPRWPWRSTSNAGCWRGSPHHRGAGVQLRRRRRRVRPRLDCGNSGRQPLHLVLAILQRPGDGRGRDPDGRLLRRRPNP